ncbi:MAG TPA: DUF1353 domain-containing protein [Nitrospira sp.]|nr:DUF1353 domain-containing protein [Nitrospira sp.]
MKYREGFKYQLAESYAIITPITGYQVEEEYFSLHETGVLTVRKGYAWDGASGPTYDTKSSLRPSLVHDVFCQMMRAGQIPFDLHGAVNHLFYELCIEDGMWAWRAWIWFKAVEMVRAGDPAQGPDRPIKETP